MADLLFKFSNTYALIFWLILLFFPYHSKTRAILIYGGAGMLSILYSVMIVSLFTNINFQDFSSLEGVKRMFSSDMAVTLGWVHYLCFDMLTGIYIKSKFEAEGFSKLIQIPVLLFTFMLGPLGFCLFLLLFTIRKKGFTFS